MLVSPARDLRIDLLRGLAVMAMIVDHVAGASPLRWLTGGNQFYTSAAEGFVLLAGITAGLVSARAVQRGTLPVTMRRFLRRGISLYVMVCATTLVFNLDQPLSQLPDILTLKQPHHFVDVLVLYAMLFVLAPLAAHLLANGRTLVLAVGSLAVWAGFQVAPNLFNLPFFVGREGYYGFPLAAWQLLFCSAMAAGYHRVRIASWLTGAWRKRLLLLAGLASMGLIILYTQTNGSTPKLAAAGGSAGPFGPIAVQDALGHGWFFAKESVRLGRLIASASIFSLLLALTSVMGARAQAVAGRLLLPFGRHSLLAFALHLVALQSLAIVATEPGIGLSLTPLASTSLQVLTLACVWLSVGVWTRVARLLRPQLVGRLDLVWQTTASMIAAEIQPSYRRKLTTRAR